MKHIHHIVPKHMGGTDDPSNLIVKVLGGKRGGKSCYEQKKGMFSLTKEERSNTAKNTINKRWRCTETGFISTTAGITKYQKHRNIDPSKREPVE